MESEIVLIPDVNIIKFEAKMEKLIKLSKKLGTTA